MTSSSSPGGCAGVETLKGSGTVSGDAEGRNRRLTSSNTKAPQPPTRSKILEHAKGAAAGDIVARRNAGSSESPWDMTPRTASPDCHSSANSRRKIQRNRQGSRHFSFPKNRSGKLAVAVSFINNVQQCSPQRPFAPVFGQKFRVRGDWHSGAPFAQTPPSPLATSPPREDDSALKDALGH
jgi:hypothetical protein